MASVRISLPSPGFPAEIGSILMEIVQFADEKASDDLYEEIRLIGSGALHVVTMMDEQLAEITDLARQGYSFPGGGSGSRSEADLPAAFAKGRIGKWY